MIFSFNNLKANCALRIVIPAGALLEQESEFGYTHMAEHFMFCGTEKYTCQKLEELQNTYCTNLKADTSYNSVTIQCEFDIDHFDIVVDMLEQMIFHWRIEENVFIEEKKDILLEMKEYFNSDESKKMIEVHSLLGRTTYTALGDIQEIEKISYSSVLDIQKYWNDFLNTNARHVIAISGELQDHQLKKLERVFSKDSDLSFTGTAKAIGTFVHKELTSAFIITTARPNPLGLLFYKIIEERAYQLLGAEKTDLIRIGDSIAYAIHHEANSSQKDLENLYTSLITKEEFEYIHKRHMEYLQDISNSQDMVESLSWFGGFYDRKYSGLIYPSKEEIEQFFKDVTYNSIVDYQDQITQNTKKS